MRSNWNFSHSVTPRSEAFGVVDSATTSNNPDYSARATALRNANAKREEAERPLPSGGTVRMW
jgi:hypothetical protein